MRKLKYHEQRLLRKVDFLQWKSDANIREIKVMRRYLIQDREDYHKYNRLVGRVKQMAAKLRELPQDDEFRIAMTEQLVQKLANLGVVDGGGSLIKAERVTVSAFCRRRLPAVMVRLKMAETLKEAVTFVEQGHVRVGPTIVNDPASLITRTLEDFITWAHGSKIRRTIAQYRDEVDDFELLGEG